MSKELIDSRGILKRYSYIFSYTIGLEKLDHAAGQVQDMQQNLFDLQPKLKQLSDETEKIMVEIERDTAEAEKKKEVVGADEAAANEVRLHTKLINSIYWN